MRRSLPAFLLAFAVLVLSAAGASAQCTGVRHVVWPEIDPVWDFCWERPLDTQYLANGGGIRIYDVKYKGTTVLRDGTIPVLNVKYGPGGCGGPGLCFRDWFYQENDYNCLPLVRDTSFPPFNFFCTGGTENLQTSCDRPGDVFGNYRGVVIEDDGASIKLTAQAAAGWYRYISTWQFFQDGTLQPGMDLTSVDHPCIAKDHNHHAYFRLDFDIDGPENDFVTDAHSGELLFREQSFVDTGQQRSKWRLDSPGSPVYVEIERNPGDGVSNAFSVADGWLLSYDANELDDGPHNINQCQADMNDFVNGEVVVDNDVVLWVHAETYHPGETGGMAQTCTMFGPTIRVYEGADFTPPACADGDDGDGDGRTDWTEDPECHGPSDDSETNDCEDGLDNDGDGSIDMDDPECVTPDWPVERNQCSDGIDNDQDGNGDADDLGCFPGPSFPLEATHCNDGMDNDGDGTFDFGDPGCASPWEPREDPQCNDGEDNDGDNKIDLADPQCDTSADDVESCGLGAELAVLLPGILWMRRRRARDRR